MVIEVLQLTDSEKCRKVNNILECLVFSDATIEKVKKVFISEMELALNMQSSSLQMENTYIPELLDGTEHGVFLAMDLGGTNLRMLLLTLVNGDVVSETVQHFPICDNLRIGCGDRLFDYLAKCVDDFAVQHRLDDSLTYPLGFTFSFPMRQNGLDSGILVTWTKSFNCPSMVGQDAVLKLRQSLLKHNRTNIEVIAILNDTTGTLMHGALLDKQTRIGIVLGTGTNGCYMEYADRVKHWEQQRCNENHVLVDVEWGAFGDNGVLDFIKTEFDMAVDNTSLLKNSFTFEKYIGGKYLGELCRVILKKLYENKLFLTGLPSEDFPPAWKFSTDNVSKIEQGNIEKSFENAKLVLESCFNNKQVNSDDLNILCYVCAVISLRAAQLIAITTSCLLNRMHDDSEVTVAIDGSLYKHHERLRQWISEFTSLWAPQIKSTFILAEDGSGKGAALVAAIAKKIQKRHSMLT